MSLLADRDRRFRRLGLKVALFAGTALGAVLVLLGLYAGAKGYFVDKTPVRFEALTGTDLKPGMAVKLSGFKIGEVHQVALNERARVDVEMLIESRYMKWIKADSVAEMAREGMIGDSYISLKSGSPELEPLPPEVSIRFQPGESLNDIANDVRNRAVPVIDGMRELLGYINDPKGDVRQGLHDVRALAAELRATRKRLDKLLTTTEKVVADDTRQTLTAARDTMAKADAALARLDTAIPALQARTETALTQLDATTAEARQTLSTATTLLQQASPRLNQTLDNSNALIGEARAAVQSARTRWPFAPRGKEEPLQLTLPPELAPPPLPPPPPPVVPDAK